MQIQRIVLDFSLHSTATPLCKIYYSSYPLFTVLVSDKSYNSSKKKEISEICHEISDSILLGICVPLSEAQN
ncbi:hypothetical protein T10_6071 [Trichinella papuae]|uniref:Uncharacterized protein n=1 Tax=Trichinella papuae TaxID=268474 RepID=A0A0V1LZ43_9BILA|nr:hypothetical protein T10_6071 [Trichinella papuae]